MFTSSFGRGPPNVMPLQASRSASCTLSLLGRCHDVSWTYDAMSTPIPIFIHLLPLRTLPWCFLLFAGTYDAMSIPIPIFIHLLPLRTLPWCFLLFAGTYDAMSIPIPIFIHLLPLRTRRWWFLLFAGIHSDLYVLHERKSAFEPKSPYVKNSGFYCFSKKVVCKNFSKLVRSYVWINVRVLHPYPIMFTLR